MTIPPMPTAEQVNIGTLASSCFTHHRKHWDSWVKFGHSGTLRTFDNERMQKISRSISVKQQDEPKTCHKPLPTFFPE